MHEHAMALGPAQTLRDEHDAIESLLVSMDGMAAALEKGARVPQRDVRAAIDVARGFADGCHHAKEEKVVFPALSATPEGRRLVQSLEGDHRAMRKLVGELDALSAAAESNDAEARARLARDERAYARLLRAHIDLETRELLPRAQRDHVAEEMARVEAEETGEGAHERYESQIEHLRERWTTAA